MAAKTGFRILGQNIRITGHEHVPRQGGVLLAVNHIGYVDFVYGGLAANPSGRKVRFMAKRELFDHRWTGPLMRSMHHIEVDRADGEASLRTALDYLGPARPSGSSRRPRSPGRWSSRSSRPARCGSRPQRRCPWSRSSSGAPSG